MSAAHDPDASDGSVLTAGLRRVLFGAILVGCLLAAIQIVAVGRLQNEIGHWAWISEINALRERLLKETQDLLEQSGRGDNADIPALFDELQRVTLRQDDDARPDENARRFLALTIEARRLLVEAERQRIALVPLRDQLAANIDSLQNLNGNWAEQLRVEERRILQSSAQLDAQFSNISEIETRLTSALLSAQLLQQQVIAVDRLAQTSSSEIIKSSIVGLDMSGLPPVCATDQDEANGRLCWPSSARVRSAISRLQNTEPTEISGSVRITLLGLEAYIRAGQGRLAVLSEEGTEALTKMRDVREQLARLRNLTESQARINRLLLDLDELVRDPLSDADALDEANRQVGFYVSQIRLRMAGLLNISPVLRGDPKTVVSTMAKIADNWAEKHGINAARIERLERFDATMRQLSSEVAQHADAVREDTTLWVSVYASNFVALAALFAASIFGLFWLARKRFFLPLVRVTGTIIALARGDLERPVVLQERAFGFDRLGNALEQLRHEMLERRALAERNSEQQRTIESSLAELERTSDEMEWLALHDPLTGLGNRRHADKDLESLTHRSARSSSDFCVMQIDIDRFKSVNDALGHPAGDYVLKSVSFLLLGIVGPDAKCYRIGGDEFLVVWFCGISIGEASSIAENVIRQVKQPIDFEGKRCNVGASIGIAFGRDAQFDATLTMMNSDLALYQVKRKGRDGFEFYSDELASMSRRRKDISDRLLTAIAEGAFTPFYQPQFYARSRRLRGLEVLCRWHDEKFGWISPVEFLSVAEELGAVGRIDEILFDKVALDLDSLSDSGLSIPRISFNVTADRLLKANLASELFERIGSRAKISLELLESMSLDNPAESVLWAIDDLRDKGIEIEIDDFGSDRASLAGLMAINPQAMKIDRTIVIPIVESPRHRELVKKILDIGAALNVEVVAEGVETELHAEQLEALGCDVLQGFGLAKPMPFDDLAEFCRSQADGSSGKDAVA